ncbi:MAG: ATP synthase F1 subunit gamma [Syntrophaceae bacterium]|nr:ATP synthase F1 subunit gamma [Syntrophaceae bacterium]
MGAALSDIKRKAKAVEKTKQITKAMNMVAAAKLKSAQLKMENFRPYASKLREVMEDLSHRVDAKIHPMLAVREPSRIKVVVMTSDKGLCGGFNSNVIRKAEGFIKEQKKEGKEVSLIAVGKKGRDYFKKKESIIAEYIDISQKEGVSTAINVMEDAIPSYVAEDYDALYLVYSEFKNIGSQRPDIVRLLPLSSLDSGDEERIKKADYVYEPSEEELLSHLIPLYLRSLILRGILETTAGEHGARMVAMDNATNNCDELIETLTLQYNKARQAAITNELMDIVGGTEALANG